MVRQHSFRAGAGVVARSFFVLFFLSIITVPAHADRQETLDKVKAHTKKLKELVDKYRKAEIPIIKHESVSIHDRRGNPKDCSLLIWYNNGNKVDLTTSNGKFEGDFDHGKKAVSKAISMRLSNCACTPKRTRHTQTWPALSEPIEKIKQVITDEVSDYAEGKAKDLAKSAFEKVAEGLGVGAKASGFLSGFAAGAELGASVGNHLTEQINKILDDVAAADLKLKKQDPFPAHVSAGRITARWINFLRASPSVSDTWDITVQCGRNVIEPVHASWHFISELTPKPPRVTTGGGQRAEDHAAQERRKKEQRQREDERKQREKEKREREAERKKEEAQAAQRYEERKRKLRAKADQIARTCTICDPIRQRIGEVEKNIAEREKAIPGLEQAVSAARSAKQRADRAQRAARDRLARFRNPTSSVTDHTTGRTVTSTDLEIRSQAAREIWDRHADGGLSADETSAEWAKLDNPAVRAGLKQRAGQRLEDGVAKASKAKDAAEKALSARQLDLTRARGALHGWQRLLIDLQAQLAECIKQCKANAMKIARGWYQSYHELPNVNSLYTSAAPKVQIKVLNVTHISGNNPFDARDPVASGDGASGTPVGGTALTGTGTNPLATSASPPSYVGNSSCGVTTTNFGIVNSSVIKLDPLGANGSTQFNVDPATGNANSQSSNLTIFGAAGHSCQIFGVTPTAFTLFCFRPGASCSEAFSR